MLMLHHVTIIIPRGTTESTVRWYSDVLGLQQTKKLAAGKSGAWLMVDGVSQVHLSERDEAGHPDSHFALVVADLDAVLQRIAIQGSSWAEQEDLFGGRRGFTRDPAGNRVELLEANGDLAGLLPA